MNVSEKSFRQLLQSYPQLCAAGLVEPGIGIACDIDFERERQRLEESFAEFAACCDWLLDCTPLRHVSFVSPLSTALLPLVAKETGIPAGNGALIAAVIHLRIPWQPLPGSPDVRVGVSLRSPALAGLEAAPQGERGRGRRRKG